MSYAKGPQDIIPPDLNERKLNENFANPYGVGDWLIHWEDFFQPQDRFAFSPLPSFPVSVEGLALFMILKKLGPAAVEKLAYKYIDSVESILNGLLKAGKASPYVGINNTTAWACVAHRFGLIDNGGYLKIVDQSRNIITVMQQLAAVEILVESGAEVAKTLLPLTV
jgi:hypothetical protein